MALGQFDPQRRALFRLVRGDAHEPLVPGEQKAPSPDRRLGNAVHTAPTSHLAPVLPDDVDQTAPADCGKIALTVPVGGTGRRA
jgi:hypothetical protein